MDKAKSISYKVRYASYLAFAISAIFTILLMTSATTGALAVLLTIGMALIMEVCKVTFFSEALTNKKLHEAVRIGMIIISVMLLLASIVASVGYIQNNANTVRNKDLIASTEYTQLEEARNIQVQLYDRKQQEISELSASYDSRINELAVLRDSYPSNFYDRKEGLQREINKLAAEKTSIIATKNNELSELGEELKNPIALDNLSVGSTSGYSAVFDFLSRRMFEGLSPTEIELYFFICLSILFEVIAIVILYLSNTYKTEPSTEKPINLTPDPAPKQKIPTPNLTPKESPTPNLSPKKVPSLSLIKANRTLSLKGSKDSPKQEPINETKPNRTSNLTPKNISDTDISKYIKYMNETAVEGISQGYIKISKNIGLSQEKCRKIKGWLENENIIKTENGRTRIVKNNIKGVG